MGYSISITYSLSIGNVFLRLRTLCNDVKLYWLYFTSPMENADLTSVRHCRFMPALRNRVAETDVIRAEILRRNVTKVMFLQTHFMYVHCHDMETSFKCNNYVKSPQQPRNS